MHKAIQAYLADLLPVCSKAGLQLCSEKEIAYGIQLEFACGSDAILLNIYYSEKKGISTVINGSKNHILKAKLSGCLGIKEVSAPQIAMHNWQRWIGSDECGKGDFFGPLIICGFHLDSKDKDKLIKLGVCDSKKLRKEQILAAAKGLYQAFPDNIECLVLKPLKYNELYANFSAQHKNLNDLMAWAHSKVLDNLIKRHPAPDGVCIDQFSPAKKASQMLRKLHPEMSIIERPDGESDIAVAAASIIARYQLVQSFQSMNKFYKLKIPMGAGKGVKEAGRAFIEQYGKERLGEIAKLHFKTTKEL